MQYMPRKICPKSPHCMQCMQDDIVKINEMSQIAVRKK